jgi:hypothetical protein
LLACLPGNDWKFASTEDWFHQVFQYKMDLVPPCQHWQKRQ